MKEREIKKRCPVCHKVLLMYKETSNNGKGKLVGKECWFCEKCGKTYLDEKDIIKTITKEILPAKLLEEKIRKEMFGLGISDDKIKNSVERIMNEGKLGLPIGGSDE